MHDDMYGDCFPTSAQYGLLSFRMGYKIILATRTMSDYEPEINKACAIWYARTMVQQYELSVFYLLFLFLFG